MAGKKSKNSFTLKEKWRFIISLIGILILCTIFIINKIDLNKEREILNIEGVKTTGVIIDVQSYKRGYRFKYEFNVNNKKYISISRTYEDIKVGQEYVVLYYPKDPNISKIILTNNHL